MNRSYPYTRRLVSRSRLYRRFAAIAAVGVACTVALLTLAWTPDPVASMLQATAPPAARGGAGHPAEGNSRAVRRIYPYSIVPGGVSGAEELARVIRTDRVVAVHYASFDVARARVLAVDKPRAVHVSYRKGGKVYWTARKVLLAPGEILLSDGRNDMRARCANRISDVPQFPVEAHRPAMEELDQAVEIAGGEPVAFGPNGLPLPGRGSSAIQTVQQAPGHAVSLAPHTRSAGGHGSEGGPGVAPATTPAATMLERILAASGASRSDLRAMMRMSGAANSMANLPGATSQPAPSPATGADAGDSSAGGGGNEISAATPTPAGGSDALLAAASASAPEMPAAMPPSDATVAPAPVVIGQPSAESQAIRPLPTPVAALPTLPTALPSVPNVPSPPSLPAIPSTPALQTSSSAPVLSSHPDTRLTFFPGIPMLSIVQPAEIGSELVLPVVVSPRSPSVPAPFSEPLSGPSGNPLPGPLDLTPPVLPAPDHGPLPGQPASVTAPFIPKTTLDMPQSSAAIVGAPAEVPEPGSRWLIVPALLAMLGLRGKRMEKDA